MITRRRLFKNLVAAVVMEAVAPGTLAEAATAAPRKLPVDARVAIAPLPPYPYAIADLLTSLFGRFGWWAEEGAGPGISEIHLPEHLDAGSMEAMVEVLWLYKPAGVLFRLHTDVPWCGGKDVQFVRGGYDVNVRWGGLPGIEVVPRKLARNGSDNGSEAVSGQARRL